MANTNDNKRSDQQQEGAQPNKAPPSRLSEEALLEATITLAKGLMQYAIDDRRAILSGAATLAGVNRSAAPRQPQQQRRGS